MNNFWQDPNTGTWYIEKTAFVGSVLSYFDMADHMQRKGYATGRDSNSDVEAYSTNTNLYRSNEHARMSKDYKNPYTFKAKEVGGALAGAVLGRIPGHLFGKYKGLNTAGKLALGTVTSVPSAIAGTYLGTLGERSRFNKLSKDLYPSPKEALVHRKKTKIREKQAGTITIVEHKNPYNTPLGERVYKGVYLEFLAGRAGLTPHETGALIVDAAKARKHIPEINTKLDNYRKRLQTDPAFFAEEAQHEEAYKKKSFSMRHPDLVGWGAPFGTAAAFVAVAAGLSRWKGTPPIKIKLGKGKGVPIVAAPLPKNLR